MRNFMLINADGEQYRLMTRQRFLYSPGGLGYEIDDTFARLGSRYVPIETGYAQGKIKGNLYFTQPNAYQKYYDFVRFCQKTPLTLAYTPDIGTFYLECKISQIDKTELNQSAALDIQVELIALGLWYRTATAINDGEQTGGKIYTYSYPYTYGESAGVLRMQSDSYENSPAKLTIFGPVTNPTWKHYVNGEEIATGGIIGTIAEGLKLVIDATQTPYTITSQDSYGNTVTNLYELSDFETERFVILRHGSNVVTVEGGTQVMLEGRLSYASV